MNKRQSSERQTCRRKKASDLCLGGMGGGGGGGGLICGLVLEKVTGPFEHAVYSVPQMELNISWTSSILVSFSL